jgi:hypothetical protein
LCWRATRQDRPLSSASLATEAGTTEHAPAVKDMIERVHCWTSEGLSSRAIDLWTRPMRAVFIP